MVLVKVERVDENLIEEIVKRILSVVNPVKIILFGSYVYGKPRKDSDLDILVIVDEDKKPGYKRVVPVNLALSDIIYPIDVFIYTKKEVEEWTGVPHSFITSIIKKGKVIYEKEA
ncbi:MAG: nucleotidyltransferase domain-containing protein [Candidatus Desulfofervidus sp.]|nr:nucleotidyltransferase domain-containing protein [Candidatus Desulfofervidus sp.]